MHYHLTSSFGVENVVYGIKAHCIQHTKYPLKILFFNIILCLNITYFQFIMPSCTYAGFVLVKVIKKLCNQ